MAIPARVSFVTLGVADLDRATRFYQALGWPLSSGSVPGDVSFFRTAGGLLALWGAKDLAADLGLPQQATAGFRATAVAMNLDSPAQVDEALSGLAA